MALRIANKVKQVVNNSSFSLEADANQSYLIKGIRVNQATTDYVTARVNRNTVGYFRVGGTQGSHLYFPTPTVHRLPLYEQLIEKGIFSPIPVPTGYTFNLTGLDSTNVVQVIYDEFDANDISPTLRNGPDATSYDYLNYGRHNGALSDGENEIDTQQTTQEYPAFPFGAVVPAKSMITLHGIAFSGIGKTSSTQANQHETNYLKFTKERRVLFDEDLNGVLYQGNASTTADQTDVGTGQDRAGNNSLADQRDFLEFAEPMVFEPGEELTLDIETTVVAGSANITAQEAEVCAILTLERI